MKHRLILASAGALALISFGVPGCSGDGDINTGTATLAPGSGGSASASPGSAGNGQTGASPAAAGAATGAVGTGAGGTSETPPAIQPPAVGMNGASAAAAQGGSGGTAGAAGAGNVMPSDPTALCPAAATSPSDGVACTVTCTDPCGIHNLGTRLCTCTNAAFDCAACAYAVQNPLLVPPTTPLPPCAFPDNTQENDATGCTENDRCQSIGKTLGATDGAKRFCGCLMNKWDCDSKPDNFG